MKKCLPLIPLTKFSGTIEKLLPPPNTSTSIDYSSNEILRRTKYFSLEIAHRPVSIINTKKINCVLPMERIATKYLMDLLPYHDKECV